MVRRLGALGLSDIYVTPHACRDTGLVNGESAEIKFARLQRMLQGSDQPVPRIHLAAEYMINGAFEQIYQTGTLKSIGGKYVLLEMPLNKETIYLDMHLFAVQARDLFTVIAHPERYSFCWEDPGRYKSYKNKGCYFQMDILSPTGYYGAKVARAARYLLKERMVDFLGTNIHNQNELRAIERFVKSGEAHRVFRNNPIINNKLSEKISA